MESEETDPIILKIAVVGITIRQLEDTALVVDALAGTACLSEPEANRAIQPRLEGLNNRPMTHLGKSRRQLFAELDQPELRPLPEKPYEFATWKTAKVNIEYHVAFEKHYYSVPHTLIHQQEEVRARERILAIFQRFQQVAPHPRSRATGLFSTRPELMPSNHRFVVELNADWLLRQAKEVGTQTRQYLIALLDSRTFPKQAYRSCLGVLSLV